MALIPAVMSHVPVITSGIYRHRCTALTNMIGSIYSGIGQKSLPYSVN